MTYFVCEQKRKASGSTCYFEFQKGYYEDKCWQEDSISISDFLWGRLHLSELFLCVIPDFDYFGINVVSKKQWDEIVKISLESNSIWQEVIAEAIPWVSECFEENEVFTILGI